MSEACCTVGGMSETTVIDCDGCPVGRQQSGDSDRTACDDCVVGLLLAVPELPRRVPATGRQAAEIGCIEFRRLNCQ